MRHRLREARLAAGLTQEQLARRLGFKAKSQYCMIENGQRGVAVETALLIADILNKPVNVLFDTLEVHAERTGTEGC